MIFHSTVILVTDFLNDVLSDYGDYLFKQKYVLKIWLVLNLLNSRRWFLDFDVVYRAISQITLNLFSVFRILFRVLPLCSWIFTRAVDLEVKNKYSRQASGFENLDSDCFDNTAAGADTDPNMRNAPAGTGVSFE